MTERNGIGIKKDYRLLNWEQNDFPIACEGCLGDSKHLRMLKRPLGAECRICARPFTVFQWQTEVRSARHKKTEICSTCAKINNCCQVCVHDLQFNLPIEVRNKLLGDQKVDLLMSEGNKEIFAHLANEQIDSLNLPYEKLEGLIRPKITGDKTSVESDGQQVVVDTGDIKKSMKDRYANLDSNQREIALSLDRAQKIVAPDIPADANEIAIWFVDEREMGTVRKKIESVVKDQFESRWGDGEAILKFENRKIAEKFLKIFDENFVVRGKFLNVDWFRPGRTLEQQISTDFFGLITEDNLPQDLPSSRKEDNLLGKRAQPTTNES